MEQQSYVLHFEGVTPVEANLYAEELRNALLDATPDLTVQRKRENPQTLDFGATLVLVLGTPAAAAAVKAIGNWLQLRSKASLTIETSSRKIIAQNISSKDAARLAELELLLSQAQEHT